MITRINIEKQNGLFTIVNRNQIPKNWILMSLISSKWHQ